MGWNPFKSLKKIVKKIGKGIKKIGKGIKKVIGKIAKPFAKLGIVGQIALGVMMPWAAGAIWQGMTGTAFSMANFGTVAGNLAQSTNLFKSVAGNIMKGVHWGATKVQGAFSSITETIGNGLNEMKTKAQELFGVNADASDLVKNTPEVSKITGKSTDALVSDTVTEKVADKTFTESLKEKTKEAILDVPSKLITGTVEGVTASFTQEPEVPYSPEVADFLSQGALSGYTKYNEVDFSKLNQYNDEINSQAGMYGNPLHTVQTMTDNSFGLNTFEYWKSQGFSNLTEK